MACLSPPVRGLCGEMRTQRSGYIESFAFSADGARLASYSDGTSTLWNLQRTKGEYQLADFGEDLFSGRVPFEIEEDETGVSVAAIDGLQAKRCSGRRTSNWR